MTGRDPRFEDERWAAAEAGLFEYGVPLHPYDRDDADFCDPTWRPVRDCIRDLNDYQP